MPPLPANSRTAVRDDLVAAETRDPVLRPGVLDDGTEVEREVAPLLRTGRVHGVEHGPNEGMAAVPRRWCVRGIAREVRLAQRERDQRHGAGHDRRNGRQRDDASAPGPGMMLRDSNRECYFPSETSPPGIHSPGCPRDSEDPPSSSQKPRAAHSRLSSVNSEMLLLCAEARGAGDCRAFC